MKFGNKNILPSDSKESIVEKINYNFDQIVSFSNGPEGRVGPKGPTGYPGAAGPRGASGATGDLPSYWYYSSSEPSSGVNEYDLWINSGATASYEIYQYLSGSWNPTGLSLLESDFFSIRNSLPVSNTSSSDFKGIYVSGDDQGTTFFVISDSDLSASDINRNNSKLLISTSDQTTKPIFSIRKNGTDASKSPAFYWSNSGSDSRIKIKSGYNFGVSSSGALSLLPYEGSIANGASGSILMSGRNLTMNSSDLILRYGAPSSVSEGNLKVTAGRNFVLNTPNFTIGSQSIQNRRGGWFNGGQFLVQPDASLSQPEGIYLVRGGTANNQLAVFTRNPDSDSPVTNSPTSRINFAIRNPSYSYVDSLTGSTLQGVDSHAVFGVTGSTNFSSTGYTNAATGSFCYHIFGNSSIRGTVGQTYGSSRTVTYFNLTDLSLYESEFITVNPISSTMESALSFYVKIPGYQSIPHPSTIYPILDQTYISETRIILNYGSYTYRNKKFGGVVYDKLTGFGSSATQEINLIQEFPFNCYYFDIMYYYNESSQIIAYIKTSAGNCIPVTITDYYGPGVASPTSGGGGSGS
jgi:hypothetical protein